MKSIFYFELSLTRLFYPPLHELQGDKGNGSVRGMTLEEFTKTHGVRFVILFGSQTEGAANEKSDYDVALLFRNPEKFSEKYTETLFAVSEHLGVPPEQVDLANLGADNILLRYEITRGGRLLFGDPDDYLQYQNFAYRDYNVPSVH